MAVGFLFNSENVTIGIVKIEDRGVAIFTVSLASPTGLSGQKHVP
jgi:hypothetical protein